MGSSNIAIYHGRLEIESVETGPDGDLLALRAWVHTGSPLRGQRHAVLIPPLSARIVLEQAQRWSRLNGNAGVMPEVEVRGKMVTHGDRFPPAAFLQADFVHVFMAVQANGAGPEGALTNAEPLSPRGLLHLHDEPLAIGEPLDVRLDQHWVRGRVTLFENRYALAHDEARGAAPFVVPLAAGMRARRVPEDAEE